MSDEFEVKDAPDGEADGLAMVDGKPVMWHGGKEYKVVSLLDALGREVETIEEGVGGIVQMGEQSFRCFTYGEGWPTVN